MKGQSRKKMSSHVQYVVGINHGQEMKKKSGKESHSERRIGKGAQAASGLHLDASPGRPRLKAV
jgi:hypothetical protein